MSAAQTRQGRLSLRELAFGIAATIALVAILVLILTADHFREASLASQRVMLERVVAVASSEALHRLEERMFAQGTEFQSRPAFRAALQQRQEHGLTEPLQAILSDPFVHGFADMREIDLAKMRLYDTELQLIDQNDSQVVMPAGMAAPLRARAAGRQGAERFRAVGALWRENSEAYYSLLVPVGGMRLLGYLELVAEPAYNLQAVARMGNMPLVIRNSAEELLYRSTDSISGDPVEVVHWLRDDLGNPVLQLAVYADVSELGVRQKETLLVAIVGVIFIVLVTTALMWLFLRRVLLEPVRVMGEEMKRCAAGDLAVRVRRGGLREFDTLAEAFNGMTQQVAATVQALERLSHIDSLTGLANRHHFDLCIEKEWRRALRSGTKFSLLLIDVDHFKDYNDHYGHVAGDECLRTVAAAIGRVVQRSTDLPARYGGEEFAVLLPDTPLASAIALAEGLMDDLAGQNLPHAAAPLGRVSVSIGVAVCGADVGCNPAGLVQAADEALYAAKRAGRNRLMVADAAANSGRCASCPGFVERCAANA